MQWSKPYLLQKYDSSLAGFVRWRTFIRLGTISLMATRIGQMDLTLTRCDYHKRRVVPWKEVTRFITKLGNSERTTSAVLSRSCFLNPHSNDTN